VSTSEQIADLERQIQPLAATLRILHVQKSNKDSIEFIRVNRITADDVELSSGDDKPWFGNVISFIIWLRANTKKRFAEWNSRLYFTSDLLANRTLETPGRLEHVEGIKP